MNRDLPPLRDLVAARAVRAAAGYSLLALTAFAVLAYAAQPLGNMDTFFHLRFGEQFLDGTWTPWHTGHLTTFESADWAPTQWLPEAVMAGAYRLGGLAAVAWLAGATYVAWTFTLFLGARRTVGATTAAALTLAALVAGRISLSARPQVLSFIAVTLITVAWLRAYESRKPPWWLIPLTWVWAMCHGMWPTGLIIGVVACVAIGRDHGLRAGARAAAVPAASLVAGLLTPVGPRLLGAVLSVDSRAGSFAEWAPLDYRSLVGAAMLVLLALGVLALLRRGTTLTVLLTLLALAWAVYSTRTVPVAAAILVPVIAAGLGGSRAPGRREIVAVTAAAVGALAVLAVIVPTTAARPAAQPSWLDPTLDRLPAGTAFLAGIRSGYLLWRHPQLDLVAYGYGDVYTDAELKRRVDLTTLQPGWIKEAKATRARYALEETDSPAAYGLETLGWKVSDESDGLVLLTAPAGWLSAG